MERVIFETKVPVKIWASTLESCAAWAILSRLTAVLTALAGR